MDYTFIVLGLVLLFLVFIVWKLSHKKRLSSRIVAEFSAKIIKTKNLAPAHSLMESHKIFSAALSHLFANKKLTSAQKTTRVQKRIPNIKSIWLHHTLRNRIAHDTDVHVSEMQAEKARRDFVRALESLG